MKRTVFSNHLTPYLLLACVLLVGILAIESARAPHPETDLRRKESAETPAEDRIRQGDFMPPPIRAYDEILKRPLFSQSREPPPPPPPRGAASNPGKAPTHIRLTLEGIAISPETRIAVLRDQTTRKMVHLAEGGNHNGWKLESVHPDRALFKRNQQTVELELIVAKKTPVKKTKIIPGKKTEKTPGNKTEKTPGEPAGNNNSPGKQ